ncbi:MAG: glycosyltransferase family 4 protein [Synergistaceae bacterium]|nr:glycosyltransferase family 4 protein [Synergistaceae bacterium]
MKVLLVASDNSIHSGAFRSLATLAKHLTDDFDVEVLVLTPISGVGTKLLDELNIKSVTIKNFPWVLSVNANYLAKVKCAVKGILNLLCVKKIDNLIKDYNPDIIHINTSWTYLAAKSAKMARVPVIWHIREFLEEDQNLRFFDRKKSVALINDSYKVICVSNLLRDKYKSLIHSDALITIYNGIDPAKYYRKEHEILKGSVLKLIFIGGVSYKKGQPQIIQALCRLNSEYPNFHFDLKIVGEISVELKIKLQRVVDENGLSSKIHFCGIRNDVDVLLKHSDVSIVNSYSEAFGRVTVESMMAGCLMLAANTGATSEIITSSGYGVLFDPLDISDVVSKLLFVNENRQKCQIIAKNGQEYVLDRFNSYRNAKEIYDVYCETQIRLHENFACR